MKVKNTIIILQSLVRAIVFSIVVLFSQDLWSFGFFAHRHINRLAVYTLPPEMMGLFREHQVLLAQRAVDPDRRAHAM